MPTIFIECTLTYESALNTGIQRVVRNVVRHAAAVAAEHGYTVCPVRIDGARLVKASASVVLRDKLAPARTAADAEIDSSAGNRWKLPRSGTALGKSVALGFLRLLTTVLPFDPVRRFAFSSGFRRRAFRLFSAPLKLVTRKRHAETDSLIVAAPGDILLLLDASWAIPGPWTAIQRFKRGGGRLAGVVYDLIPLNYPDACLPEHVAVFKHWFKKLVCNVDAFLCISKAVAARLAERLPPDRSNIGYFYLGSELDFLTRGAEVRPAVKDIFGAERPIFVVVGSIEPRKNCDFVLDAFEQFWRTGAEGSLVFIGKPAWKSEQIVRRIHAHAEWGRRLFLLRDASDTELDYAYRHAAALVAASSVEGFGLPVIEAFQRGLPVFCSDIPAFREIAGGKGQFFVLDDARHLSALLLNYADRPLSTDRIPQRWPTWRESTEQLISTMLKILPAGEEKTRLREQL